MQVVGGIAEGVPLLAVDEVDPGSGFAVAVGQKIVLREFSW